MKYLILLLFLFVGCSKPAHSSPNIEPNEIIISPSLSITADSLNATIITNINLASFDSLSKRASHPISFQYLTKLAYPSLHDSTISSFVNILENSISFNQRRRSLNKLYNQNGAIIADYILDTTLVLKNIRNKIAAYEQKTPIMPLFDRGSKVPDFNEIIPTKGFKGWDYVLIGKEQTTEKLSFKILEKNLTESLVKLHKIGIKKFEKN